MKILLDTQAFLWLLADAPQPSKKVKKLFLDPANDLFLSLTSVWEMAVKASIGKLVLGQPLEKFIPSQLQENSIIRLDITFRHVVRVAALPFHHRDPFDHLLISQALEEDLPILSSDKKLDEYNIERLW